jgi:hypothetical protein
MSEFRNLESCRHCLFYNKALLKPKQAEKLEVNLTSVSPENTMTNYFSGEKFIKIGRRRNPCDAQGLYPRSTTYKAICPTGQFTPR